MDHLQPTTPCPKKWAELEGEGTARRCAACNLHVTNLSELTRTDAKTFLSSRTGRTCIAVQQRPDGTTAYRDEPLPPAPRRAWRHVIAATLPAFLAAWLPGCESADGAPAPQLPESNPVTTGTDPRTLAPEEHLLLGSVPMGLPVDQLGHQPVDPPEELPQLMGEIVMGDIECD